MKTVSLKVHEKEAPKEVIRKCAEGELGEVLAIINDAARLYKGIIPEDCMREPYMTREELDREVGDGVEFWVYTRDGWPCGVMGIQYKEDVTLIRHAYVRSSICGQGIGGRLLDYLVRLTDKPVLVGTWRAAEWSIRFYRKHGFRLVGEDEHAVLLDRYWKIPARQVESSVVLANNKWFRKWFRR